MIVTLNVLALVIIQRVNARKVLRSFYFEANVLRSFYFEASNKAYSQ